MDLDKLFTEAQAKEIRDARLSHPKASAMLAVLMEEVGEVAKAILEESREKIWKEAVQVAAMAQRLATEGDLSHDDYRQQAGLVKTRPHDAVENIRGVNISDKRAIRQDPAAEWANIPFAEQEIYHQVLSFLVTDYHGAPFAETPVVRALFDPVFPERRIIVRAGKADRYKVVRLVFTFFEDSRFGVVWDGEKMEPEVYLPDTWPIVGQGYYSAPGYAVGAAVIPVIVKASEPELLYLPAGATKRSKKGARHE